MSQREFFTLTLQESIRATVATYDFFSFPLTEREVWTHLYACRSETSYGGFLSSLERMVTERRLEITDGYLHLPGREAIVSERGERAEHAVRKFSRASWMAKLLSHIPFIRFIAVCNSLAFANASDESDIDFFIIAERGWAWTVRALAVTLASVMRVRPYQRGDLRDTICLSFFVDASSLSLEPLALRCDGGLPDVYLCSWIRNLFPLFDEDGVYGRFLKENGWVEKYFQNPAVLMGGAHRSVRLPFVGRVVKKAGETLLQPFSLCLESAARRLQLWRMPQELKEMANKDTRVVLTESVLKFHPNDRRNAVRAAVEKHIQEMAHTV